MNASLTSVAADADAEGNSRLTAVNGTMLIGLLALEGVTILDVRGMITLHMYLGVLLVGPVLLKCASTIYRFGRYYTGAPAYVRKGPPHPILRILGPVVILSSLAVLGTGIGLIYTGPEHSEPLLTLHKAAFIIWLVATGVHVLGHLFEAGSATLRELRDPRVVPAARHRRRRIAALVASLALGVGLATALIPAANTWTSHRFEHFDEHGLVRSHDDMRGQIRSTVRSRGATL